MVQVRGGGLEAAAIANDTFTLVKGQIDNVSEAVPFWWTPRCAPTLRVGSADWRCSDGEKKVCTNHDGGSWQRGS